MSVTATWMVWPEEEGGDFGYPTLSLSTPSDVDALVAANGHASADVATLVHADRVRPVEVLGTQVMAPEHDVFALVKGGYGYLSYQEEFKEYAVGDPESPEIHAEDEQFPAGSGLPLDLFKNAIIELIATAHKPTCVAWIAAEQPG